MAIISNNVQNIKFLRNSSLYATREAALAGIEENKGLAADGSALLARYESSGTVKTIVGFVAESGNTKYLTIIDVEGGSSDVEALRQEINAKLGDGISSANTATAQLAALSGNGQSTSAETSVEGAKRYAEDLISNLDYTDAAVAGEYVSQVTQADGVIAVTRVALPSSADTAVAKKFVTAVAEDKGQIEVTRGEISSSAATIVLSDNADGGVNFEVNIDNETLVADENTGVISVADAALTQYVGDEDTIHISEADAQNNKTVSSLLTIQKVTTGLSEIVKEEYHLVGASGNTIGAPVQIYKDSSIVSITYITDSGDTHYQNLEYVYIDASGNTQTEYVDISSLVLEAEFASGVTVTNHVAHGVVDPQSETFLTVGADGFKLSGVQDAIDNAVSGLDATVTGETSGSHITISIEELDGKLVQSGLTIEENDIASATDLAALSAKTVTVINSSNSSISATSTAAADGTVEYDIVTDADKIQMSGFSADSASALSGIAESDSIATAFEKTNTVITENERVTANALTDLDGRLDVIESGYVETVKVNNVALAETDNAVNVQISGATAAATATGNEAIVVTTNEAGAITLGIATLDCGTY